MLLLETLDTFGLLSTQQIENHIFNNIDKSTVLRRVSCDKVNKNPSIDEVTKIINSARLLILPKRLQALLSQMKKEAMSDLVFTDNKGELLRYNAIQSAFNAGFEALNLPWRSTHICRHTFATLALMETKIFP